MPSPRLHPAAGRRPTTALVHVLPYDGVRISPRLGALLAALLLQALAAMAWSEDLVCQAHPLPAGAPQEPSTALLTPGPLACDQHRSHVPIQLKPTLDVSMDAPDDQPVVTGTVSSAEQDRLQRLGLGMTLPPPVATAVSLAPPPLTTRAANSIRLSGDWRNWACIGAAISRQF